MLTCPRAGQAVKRRQSKQPKPWRPSASQLAFDFWGEERPRELLLSEITIESAMRLWSAVFRKGLRDRDKDWANDIEADHVGSFTWCCDILGLRADTMRAGLMRQ